MSEIMAAVAAAQLGLDELPPGTHVEHESLTTLTRVRFLFPNGLGLSVVRGLGTYGAEEGLLEVAVLPGIDDVLGWRTFEDVRALIWEIAARPAAPPAHPTLPGDEGW